MQLGDGRFESVAATRPPTVIEDAFKKTKCASVAKVIRKLDLGMIYDWLPATFPLDRAYADVDRFSNKVFLGINKYPLDEWKKTSRPYMSDVSWVVFALLLAAGKTEEPGMEHLMEMALGMYERDPKEMEYSRTLSVKNVRKRAWERYQDKANYPQDMKQVMEVFNVPHQTVSKEDLQQTESDLKKINQEASSSSGW